MEKNLEKFGKIRFLENLKNSKLIVEILSRKCCKFSALLAWLGMNYKLFNWK